MRVETDRHSVCGPHLRAEARQELPEDLPADLRCTSRPVRWVLNSDGMEYGKVLADRIKADLAKFTES